jgi:hypothetical protein
MAHLLLSSDTHDESHFKPLNYAQIHRATKDIIYNMCIYIYIYIYIYHGFKSPKKTSI